MQHEAILILNSTTVEAEFNVTVTSGEDMQRLCRIVAYYYLVEAIDNDSNIYYYMKQNAMDALAYWVSLQAMKEFRCYEAKIEESEKGRQPSGVEPRTPGWCRQCSATELRQADNHQPPQSSICTAQVVLKCLSRKPGSHSVCACRQNSVRGRPENSLHQERTHAEWFSHSKCSEHLASAWVLS